MNRIQRNMMRADMPCGTGWMCRWLHWALAVSMALTAAGCHGPATPPEATRSVRSPDASGESTSRIVRLGQLRRISAGGDESAVDLLGKPTIVVFWTPLCSPSRDAVVRLAGLAREFEGAGWNVAAMTFHASDDIHAAVGEMQVGLDGPLLICRDDFGRAFREMGIDGTPVAAVFDAKGRLLGHTHPAFLTSPVIRAALDTGQLDAPVSSLVADEIAPDAWDLRRIELSGNEPPIAEIQRVDHPGQFARFDPETGMIVAPGASPRSLLRSALDMPAGRFIWDGIDEAESPYFSVKIVPHDGSLRTAKRQLASMLQTETGWHWTLETEAREAWILGVDAGGGPVMSDAKKPSVKWMGPAFDSIGTTGDLARWLESITNTPVVDDTRLGAQLFQMQVKVTSAKELEPALAEIGLTLRKANADVEVVRVSRRTRRPRKDEPTDVAP